ncbi:hypothetical protein BDN72DRAFT_835755 [Pluteus cervinus]|uniref:Uncharacterized protein n=1 Tax=Pluteus cervinus TaxID=181527 RepID=A0ACD3B4F2_9AGAR|nr:hypothetical protein BDN72DRAFT_835755 [Pluteus cervinus]
MEHRNHPNTYYPLLLCRVDRLRSTVQSASESHPFPQLQQVAFIMYNILALVPDNSSPLKQFVHNCLCVVYVTILTVNTGSTSSTSADILEPSYYLEKTLGEIYIFTRKYARRPWYHIIIPKTKMYLRIADYQERLKGILGKFNLDQEIPFHVLAQQCYEAQARATRLPCGIMSEQRVGVPILGPDNPNVSFSSGQSGYTPSAFAIPRSQVQRDLSCTNVQGNQSTMHIQNATIYISPLNFDVGGISQLAAAASPEETTLSDSETPTVRRQRSCPAVTMRCSPSVEGAAPTQP